MPPAGRDQNELGALQRGLVRGLPRTEVPADDERRTRPACQNDRDVTVGDENVRLAGGSHELTLSVGKKEPERTDEFHAVRDPAHGMIFGKAAGYVEADTAGQEAKNVGARTVLRVVGVAMDLRQVCVEPMVESFRAGPPIGAPGARA